MIRLAVVGTGMMAQKRAHAFVATGKAVVVGVASARLGRAADFARMFDAGLATDRFHELTSCRPDAVLIEVPHHVQQQVIEWSLDQGYHVLAGSVLAPDTLSWSVIHARTQRSGLIVEAGFEARYKRVWKTAKNYLQDGKIGTVSAVQSIACWAADPESWYYNQEKSGGMPLTHMTYAFLNPLNWLLGAPESITAIANAHGVQRPGMPKEVNCAVLMTYPGNIIASVHAGYLHFGSPEMWKVTLIGTAGSLEIYPAEFGDGWLVWTQAGKQPVKIICTDKVDPFEQQANLFCDAIVRKQYSGLQNTPEQAKDDVRIIEALLESLSSRTTVSLSHASLPVS